MLTADELGSIRAYVEEHPSVIWERKTVLRLLDHAAGLAAEVERLKEERKEAQELLRGVTEINLGNVDGLLWQMSYFEGEGWGINAPRWNGHGAQCNRWLKRDGSMIHPLPRQDLFPTIAEAKAFFRQWREGRQSEGGGDE
jgi:hypothetical protein